MIPILKTYFAILYRKNVSFTACILNKESELKKDVDRSSLSFSLLQQTILERGVKIKILNKHI